MSQQIQTASDDAAHNEDETEEGSSDVSVQI